MHANGLHCYDLREDITKFAFMETVAGNKKGFAKRQIKGAETAKSLYPLVVVDPYRGPNGPFSTENKRIIK